MEYGLMTDNLTDELFRSSGGRRRMYNMDIPNILNEVEGWYYIKYELPIPKKLLPVSIGGGEHHAELGRIIYSIYPNLLPEQWLDGGRVDLLGDNLIIEVGDTDPSRIPKYLKSDYEYVLVPFQLVNNNITCYSFILNDIGWEYVAKYEIYMWQQMKKMMGYKD